MEGDVKSLRLELEGARNTLRVQSTRCRQIVAAFTRKLEEKEIETRNSRLLRDQQLSQVVRALLVLEARLRREQRSIRSLLGERDAVIRSQQLEIARLKKALNTDSDTSTSTEPIRETIILMNSPTENKIDCDVKPDLISSLGISEFNTRKEILDNEDTQSNMDSLQLSLYEFESQPDSLLSDLSTQSCNGDVLEIFEPNSNGKPSTTEKTQLNQSYEHCSTNLIYGPFKPEEKYTPNPLPHIEIKNNTRDRHEEKYSMLTPVSEESMNHSFSPWNHDRVNNNTQREIMKHKPETEQKKKEIKPSPSTLLQEVRIGSNKNEYEDNPVLNCVNQILLRDQEEFLEEQRALRLKEQERNKIELKQQGQDDSGFNNTSKDKHMSSVRKLTFEDKAVLLQLPNKVEHEDTKNSNERKEDVNKDKHLANSNMQNRSVIPPALPPKPSRLLSKHLDNRLVLDTIQHKYLPQSNRIDMKHIEIINKRTSLPNPSTDNELYVISNSAIDDELLQQLQGRKSKICSELGIGLNSNRTRPLSIGTRDGLYTAGNHSMPHPTHKLQGKLNNGVNSFLQMDLDTPKKGYTGKEESGKKSCQQQSPTKKTSSPSTIKVASPVSSLIATVESIAHEEPRKETSPSVSQIVRRFEDLGTKKETMTESGDDTLRKNFEEFRLDDCDMEALCSGLEDGNSQVKDDGAEQRLKEAAAALEARVSYENFLEATGLSQKSIMTPSRMFSNHKSVMKPKDVKHRNRVKAAAVIERCSNPQALSNSTVRYWTEPFL